MNNSNRGMFLETLINQTCWYYENNQIALIFKRHIPMTICEKNGMYVKAKLLQNAATDYYGSYHGKMIDFEAKQTAFDYFISSNIKKHQRNHLQKCVEFGIFSFVIIHFLSADKYFAIDYIKLSTVISKSKIDMQWFRENTFELEVVFPGILNIKDFLDKHNI
ncbi:MAG: Holliday junction resolvase RecU [Mycoplasma sp.]